MRIYRGYYLQVAPLSGRTEIFTPDKGERVDTQPSEAEAEKVIDEWQNAK